jgi:hypothetical protein
VSIHHIAGRWEIKVVDETKEVFVECDGEVIVRLMDRRRKVRRGELIDKHDCSEGKRQWQQDQATLPGQDQPLDSSGTVERTWTFSSLLSHRPSPRVPPSPTRLAKESTSTSQSGLSTMEPRG